MADCKIIILGAGLAGLGMAAQLQRQLNEHDFEIYEKLDNVGGTWAQNTYPNLSCDVPSEVIHLCSDETIAMRDANS